MTAWKKSMRIGFFTNAYHLLVSGVVRSIRFLTPTIQRFVQ